MASEIRVDRITHTAGVGTITPSPTGVHIAGIVTGTTFSGSGASLTSLPAAQVTGTLPAISGANLTNLAAANLTGTIADARFPATLPAASAANLTSIPAANVTGTLPALTAANLTNIPAANIVGVCTSGLTKTGGFGKLIQVLQTVKTDTYSTNSTSYGLITGLTQAITATSTSNKILINVTLYGGNSGAEYAVGFQLAKDGSAISGAIGAASGNNQESGTIRFRQGNTNHAEEGSFMFLDTPADTSAHTYGVLMKVFNGSYYGKVGTTGADGNYNQHMRCPCTITVMEVGV